MSWIKALRREVLVNAAGIREGLISVAERVDARTERVRCRLEASEREGRVRERLVRLGRRLFERRQLLRSDLQADSDVGKIVRDINILQQEIRELNEIANESAQFETYEGFIELQQALQKSGKTLQIWRVERFSPFRGREIREVQLTENSFVLVLVRREKIVPPTERVHLAAGDQLLVIGPALELESMKGGIAG